MALAVQMQIRDERRCYVNPFEVEKGGILSLTSLSGIPYVVYEPNPNENTVPMGLMMHDQESVDLCRANAPWRTRRAYPAYTCYPYLIRGEVITNAIHPAADPTQVRPGAPIYLAPSGLITCSPSYNSRQIGTFLSTINDPRLSVPGGLGPCIMRVGGNEAIVNPQGVFVSTAGWAKISLRI